MDFHTDFYKIVFQDKMNNRNSEKSIVGLDSLSQSLKIHQSLPFGKQIKICSNIFNQQEALQKEDNEQDKIAKEKQLAKQGHLEKDAKIEESLSVISQTKLEEARSMGMKKRKDKKLAEINLDDPEQVEDYLRKNATTYQKNLMNSLLSQQKTQASELKQQQTWISIDQNINIFPIDSQNMKLGLFDSIEQLREKLKEQEQQILKVINKPNVVSIFYESLEQSIKKSGGSKSFHSFRCKIQGCKAILKCSYDAAKQICDLYLLRNKHNHTISGLITQQAQSTTPQTIVLDEQLHEMFGFNKGVRSQTRNLRYMDASERKLDLQKKRREQKKNVKREGSQAKMQNEENIEEEKIEVSIPTKKSRKIIPRPRKIIAQYDRKVEDVEFKNMFEELSAKRFIIEVYSPDDNVKYPQFAFISKPEFITLVKNPTTLRFIFREQVIKLNKNREPINNIWSFLIITALNQSLNPLILAFCISSNPMLDNLPRVLPLLEKYFPHFRFLLSEYNSDLLQILLSSLKQLKNSCKLLLDHLDVVKSMKKHFKAEEHMVAVKELMNPVNYYSQQKLERYLRKRRQGTVLKKYQKLKQYTHITDQHQFYGIGVDLSPQRQLMIKLKERLRKGLNRHSLRVQLHNLVDCMSSNNKKNQVIQEEVLEIEKVHHDSFLKLVRQSVSPPILNQFYLRYSQALDLSFEEKDQDSFSFEKGKAMVTKNVCSCGYSKIVGLPCKHLIKISKDQKKPYLNYFNKKWIIKDRQKQEQQKSEERSRSREMKLLEKKMKRQKKQKQNHKKFDSKRSTSKSIASQE